MSDTPIFSVIVPVFNGANHLDSAIRSIRAQSYPYMEILAVDDGSSDDSLERLQELSQQSSLDMRVLRHPDGQNHGIVATYRLGVSQARGKYIAFLEQDDAWTSNYLSRKADIFAEHDRVGVVFSPYKVVTTGLMGREMALRQWLVQWRMPSNAPFNNFKHLIRFNNVATFSCFTARKEMLDAVPLPGDRAMVYYDWWTLLSLSMQTDFYYDRRSLCYWRHSPASTLGRQSWPLHCDRMVKYFASMYDFLDGHVDQLCGDRQRQYARHRRHVPMFLELLARRDAPTLLRSLLQMPAWALSTTASLCVNYLKFRGRGELRRSQRPESAIRPTTVASKRAFER